ncbi:hypothetical protein Fcan01_26782 [Folsomia candida]|uniref:Uncharacterized protein n=1 Tax=Folsomia candida TaxID=158441 RepID=A0A226CYP9_FOLCA|nr:hypothetical protein Fcan01_26782 [Folsomia candida]
MLNPFDTPKRDKPNTSTPRPRGEAFTPSPTAPQKTHKAESSSDTSFDSCEDSTMAQTDPNFMASMKAVIEEAIAPIAKEIADIKQICSGSTIALEDRLDKMTREKNLVIHGVKEDAKENIESRLKALDEVWTSIGMPNILVDDAFRVGKKDPTKPRAIIVKMVRKVDRDLVLIKKKALGKSSTISIRKDQSRDERLRDSQFRRHFSTMTGADKDLSMSINHIGKMTIWKGGKIVHQFAYDPIKGVNQI